MINITADKITARRRARVPTTVRTSVGRAVAAGLVDAVRDAIRKLVALGQAEARGAALSLLVAHWAHLQQESPLTEDLRPWQLLASDLAVALEPIDGTAAVVAREIADEMRSTVTILARNPADQLALRPATRRVLEALYELGGRAEPSEVRKRSGHSATHLSNALKALRGHGLVRDEAVPTDQRRKQLVLTDRGRDEMAGQRSAAATDASFRSAVQVRESAASDDRYSAHVRGALA